MNQHLPLADFYQGRILNFAHRGARLQAPENTMPAFERAAKLGADGIEFDVQLCSDGVPVIFHDFHLDKLCNKSGLVTATPLAVLRELDAGSHFSDTFAGTPIPTLDEVFEEIGSRLLLNVELKAASKDTRLAEVVIERISKHGLTQRLMISSFNPVILKYVRRVAPQIPIGYLYEPRLPWQVWLFGRMIGNYEAEHPHFASMNSETVRRAHSRGHRVNVWTVNEAADIRRMRDIGVDMIMSDAPDVVAEVLNGASD